ncbi:hypothetical protein JS531_03650 [Bifidobacterium sp. CP2]|uniref:hypothetical protein n=1 Tax=Bifidobacterium sp. CP2 TaxID=2809025 RepID=UPI001BDC54AB|nr:hypothetical protein [Bifidobacterium sp. CP2]MBT1181077.1 hypothetical protein [Bifidobacterium sp. CP2]
MGSPEFEAFMKQMDDLSQQIKEQRAKFEKEKARVDKMIAEKHEDIESKRRSGEYGHAWQVLQQRIDMGKTCENDIYAGIDKSPEAREVRGYLEKSMGLVRDRLEDVDDPDNEAAHGRAELDEGMRRLHAQEAELNRGHAGRR